nr:unnamed protein product [Callosobruchus analis]
MESFRRGELREIGKSKRTATSADDIYEPTLWYFDLLSFTEDQEEVRPGISSTDIEDSMSEDEDSQTKNDGPMTPITSTSQESNSRPSSRQNIKGGKTLDQKKARFLDVARAEKATFPVVAFGKSVAEDLGSMKPDQAIVAQKLISDIVYYGKQRHFSERSNISVFPNQSVAAPQVIPYPTYQNHNMMHAQSFYYNDSYPSSTSTTTSIVNRTDSTIHQQPLYASVFR